MKVTKENKGITLVALIITVIILIIIAGVSINYTIDGIQQTKDELLISELEQVQYIIGENYLNYIKTKNNVFLVGRKITNLTEITNITNNLKIILVRIPNEYINNIEASYYEINPTELKSLGIENSENTYIVNYLTGEVINKTEKKTSDGTPLYSYLRKNFNIEDVTAF